MPGVSSRQQGELPGQRLTLLAPLLSCCHQTHLLSCHDSPSASPSSSLRRALSIFPAILKPPGLSLLPHALLQPARSAPPPSLWPRTPPGIHGRGLPAAGWLHRGLCGRRESSSSPLLHDVVEPVGGLVVLQPVDSAPLALPIGLAQLPDKDLRGEGAAGGSARCPGPRRPLGQHPGGLQGVVGTLYSRNLLTMGSCRRNLMSLRR